jgi:hypothetical protein
MNNSTLKPTTHLLEASPIPNLTEEQIEKVRKAFQARANAKHSTGPRTEQGRRIAAQNARKHGYAGAQLVLEEEDQEAYEMHLDSYFASFNPVTQAECDYIRRAAEAQWRLDRLTSIETGILELELDFRYVEIDANLENVELRHYLAVTFIERVRSDNALELCRRYQSGASRDGDRAVKMFLTLKNERLKDEKALKIQADPNEPTIRQPKRAEVTPIRPAKQESPSAKLPQFNNRRRKDRRKSS